MRKKPRITHVTAIKDKYHGDTEKYILALAKNINSKLSPNEKVVVHAIVLIWHSHFKAVLSRKVFKVFGEEESKTIKRKQDMDLCLIKVTMQGKYVTTEY